MASVRLGAASMAYRRAIAKSRKETKAHPDTPAWLLQFEAQLPPEDTEETTFELIEPTYHKKERLYAESEFLYERIAWFIYKNITSTAWFEGFILISIILIAVTTGVELEDPYEHGSDKEKFYYFLSKVTVTIFTSEVILKIVAEGYEPWQFFSDPENGNYNTFDFFIVTTSLAFAKSTKGAVGGFRMLKLIRLLTFIKNVPQLRMIIAGLIHGVKSTAYIVILLSLVLYIFAILGCILFGDNDPAHFGHVGTSMVTLFQVSTLTNWSNIAYISWYGCEDYIGSAYDVANAAKIPTMTGDFQGYTCLTNQGSPALTGLFFGLYIVFTSWVIMSIFIGVISVGMFESYLTLKQESNQATYIKKLAENTMSEAQAFKTGNETLKYKIEKALDENFYKSTRRLQLTCFDNMISIAIEIRDGNPFAILITSTIIVVGILSGGDTNHILHCNRLKLKGADDDARVSLQKRIDECDHTNNYFTITFIIAQAIFTFECLVKILAEGYNPLNYFIDNENGSWNRLDFIVVFFGFIEYADIQVVFPIFVLRLVRLVRVLRLAKALPRLRAIVEALISSFASVGWICGLILVFNYIFGCLCIVFFRENDPFHFGSVSRAMFSVLRIETLDEWDQILYITMYGCKGYPDAYPFVVNHPSIKCDDDYSHGTGYLGMILIFLITLIGAYVLPTVLVGIVSIKFDNSTRRLEVLNAERLDIAKHLAIAQEHLPDFFTPERVNAIEKVFQTLDTKGIKMLDLAELSPFLQYAFDYLFNIELTPEQCESIFFLCDLNHSTEIGLGEFLAIISVIKQMKIRSKKDPEFASRIFNHDSSIEFSNSKPCGKSKWDAAMERVDADSLHRAWDIILKAVNSSPGDSLKDKAVALFDGIDSDESGELESSELGAGLKACGVYVTDRQMLSLIHVLDYDNSGNISREEFAAEIIKESRKRDTDNGINNARNTLHDRNHISNQSIQVLNLTNNRDDSDSTDDKSNGDRSDTELLGSSSPSKKTVSYSIRVDDSHPHHETSPVLFPVPPYDAPSNKQNGYAPVYSASTSASASTDSSTNSKVSASSSMVRSSSMPPLSLDQKPQKPPKNLKEAMILIESLRQENQMLRIKIDPKNADPNSFSHEELDNWLKQDSFKKNSKQVNGRLRTMSIDDAQRIGKKI